jgi:poly(3-hydroxybutyrate) depolymerase
MKRVLLVSLLVLGTRAALAESKLAIEEKQALTTIARDWVELGRWCVPRELGSEARLCAGRAAGAAVLAPGVADLVAAVASCADGGSASDAREWAKKLHAAGKKIAASYDRVVDAGASERDPGTVERLDRYRLLGLELDPGPRRWERILALGEAAAGERDQARAGRLAEGALGLEPSERFLARLHALADAPAIQGCVLLTAGKHPMRYYLSLPPGFERTRGKKWPVLVTLDGSGSLFEGAAKGWRDNRGKLGLIIVSPCTFANAGRVSGNEAQMKKYRQWYTDPVIAEASKQPLDFDEAGILAVLADLERTHDAEGRAYLTGFSAGGRATYMMIRKHSGLLNAVAPVCAVSGHQGGGDPPSALAPEDRSLPVNIISGEKDERSVAGAEAAAAALERAGYANVKRTTVAGMGHSPAMVQVIDTFRPYLEGKKKRGEKQD